MSLPPAAMAGGSLTWHNDLHGKMGDMPPVIKVTYGLRMLRRGSRNAAEQPSKRLNTRPIPLPSKRARAAKRNAALYHARPLLSLYPNERI